MLQHTVKSRNIQAEETLVNCVIATRQTIMSCSAARGGGQGWRGTEDLFRRFVPFQTGGGSMFNITGEASGNSAAVLVVAQVSSCCYQTFPHWQWWLIARCGSLMKRTSRSCVHRRHRGQSCANACMGRRWSLGGYKCSCQPVSMYAPWGTRTGTLCSCCSERTGTLYQRKRRQRQADSDTGRVANHFQGQGLFCYGKFIFAAACKNNPATLND